MEEASEQLSQALYVSDRLYARRGTTVDARIGPVAKRRASKMEVGAEPDHTTLRHVLIVGGSLADWHALTAQQWVALRAQLAAIVAQAGAMWLTIRPYSRGAGDTVEMQRSIDLRDGCTVTVDPCADGQQRLLNAIDQLRDAGVTEVNEAAIAAVLMAPAPAEPDLAVVLGPSTQLPESLVWDLAYSELVFVDTTFQRFGAVELQLAIDEFSRRHRRFGGVT